MPQYKMFTTSNEKKALLIANTYIHNKNVHYLKYSKEDIIRTEKLLLNKLQFKKENIKKYIDVNIQDILENFIKTIQNGDLIFIYFSGHGDSLVKSTHLPKEIGLLSSWINIDETLFLSYHVDKMLSDIKKDCKIIICSDSCYSGKFIDYYEGKNTIYFLGATKSSKTSSYKVLDKNKSGGLIILLEYLLENKTDIDFDTILEDTINYRNRNSFLGMMVTKSKNNLL